MFFNKHLYFLFFLIYFFIFFLSRPVVSLQSPLPPRSPRCGVSLRPGRGAGGAAGAQAPPGGRAGPCPGSPRSCPVSRRRVRGPRRSLSPAPAPPPAPARPAARNTSPWLHGPLFTPHNPRGVHPPARADSKTHSDRTHDRGGAGCSGPQVSPRLSVGQNLPMFPSHRPPWLHPTVCWGDCAGAGSGVFLCLGNSVSPS